MEVNGQPRALAALLIEQEVGWTLQTDWTHWRTEKSIATAKTLHNPTSSVVTL
jgi:hypothetical protein